MFYGHCEVSSKVCPVFPYKAVLGLDAHSEMVLEKTSRPDGMTPHTQSLPTDKTPPARCCGSATAAAMSKFSSAC